MHLFKYNRVIFSGAILLGAVLACAQQLPGLAQMGPSSSSSSSSSSEKSLQSELNNPLLELNQEFRQVYSAAKERAIRDTQPLILCYSDKMILVDGDKRDEFSFLPARYSQLKVVDHVPLALFVLLQPACDKMLAPDVLAQLKKIRVLTLAARPTLADPGLGLDSVTLNRQYLLLDQSIIFMDKAIAGGYVTNKELLSFCHRLKPQIMLNAAQAVATQLETMDNKVSEWKKQLGDQRFSKLQIVIVSGHMPREEHSCFQYFAKVFDVKREGLQIVYSEGAAEEKAARELVGTHVLDASIGAGFFDEPLRMHRDLLADGAKEYLRSHRPKAKI